MCWLSPLRPSALLPHIGLTFSLKSPPFKKFMLLLCPTRFKFKKFTFCFIRFNSSVEIVLEFVALTVPCYLQLEWLPSVFTQGIRKVVEKLGKTGPRLWKLHSWLQSVILWVLCKKLSYDLTWLYFCLAHIHFVHKDSIQPCHRSYCWPGILCLLHWLASLVKLSKDITLVS